MAVTLRLTVDLSVLRANLAALRQLTKAKICAVVKANVYGHGYGAMAALADADEFAVSCVKEAKAVLCRTDKPVNILSLPDKTVPCGYREGMVPAVATPDDVDFAAKHGARVVNVKLHTGMNRYGARPEDLNAVFFAADRAHLTVKSIFSHVYDLSAAPRQFERFMGAVKPFEGYFSQKHLLASNFTRLPPHMHLDMVRPGLVLYGYGHECVRPVAQAKCAVTQVRDVFPDDNIGYGICKSGVHRRVAVLSAGYADGCRRKTGAPRYVAIGGHMCAVVGQICMDAMMADVSGLNVRVGDEAYILGYGYDADALAVSSDTIPYEILTGFGARVRRNYTESGERSV